MKNEYDILVIGGGPAGALAAETAAKAGVSVLLVEKRGEIGTPIRCAEGILKKDLEQFIEPDTKWISAVIRRGALIAPNGKTIIVSSKTICGYTLNRKLFDRALIMRAIAAGAEVEVRARARPIREAGKIVGAVIVQNGTELKVRSKVVIAADGVESQFAKRAGINTTLSPAELGTCCQYLVANIDIAEDTNQFYFVPDTAPGAYIWVFPKGNRTANIGIGISGDASANGHRAKDLLDEFIKDHFPAGKILELITGGVPQTKPLETTIADGLVIAGDAAHLSDALTGGGIYQAMYSGRLAGETAAAAVKAGDTSKMFLQKYDDTWRNSSFGLELRAMYAIHMKYRAITNENVNELFAYLSDIELRSVTVLSAIIALGKKNPKLLLKLPAMIKHMSK